MLKIKLLFGILATAWFLSTLTHYQAIAQELPPLYQDTPVNLVPAQSIAKFPVNTFLESIVVSGDGTLFITSHEDGQIIRISPDGTQSIHATIEGKVAGLAWARRSSLLVTGWDSNMTPTVFLLSSKGKVKKAIALPDAAFLNGITRLKGDRYLIADSYRGAIWELDLSQGRADIWIEHPLLDRATPESRTPGVNGLKIFAGILYASNTDKAHLLRIPITKTGRSGEPEIFVQNALVDDFAFDVEGNLYGATHVFNSVIRIAPDGAIATIAEGKQGVTGSTAIAFGRRKHDRKSIYVVTNGGMFLPPPTGIVPAEVVRLEVGLRGRSR